MYLRYFNLKEEPFSMTPDPRFLFHSHQHEAAIAALVYGIEQRRGFLLLTGEIGTGKTTVCREVINRLHANIEISVILNPLLSVTGLLQAINKDFDNRRIAGTAEEQLEALNRFLLSRSKNGHNAVVLIDEAQNLSVEALEMTRLLSNLETDKHKLVQIVLVGQPELETTLKDRRLRQLAQRISIHQRLRTLNAREMRQYIFHRLSIAGGEGRLFFERRAVKRVCDFSRGYPRVANILCDRVLLAAYARRTRTITKEVVQEAITDLRGTIPRPWWRFWSCPSF